MTICINPSCPNPEFQGNNESKFCQSCGSSLDLFGGYRVLKRLDDRSYFAQVYEIYGQGEHRILKVLKRYLAEDPKTVELFQQEANILSKLDYPGLPKYFSYFQYQTRNSLTLHCQIVENIEGINLEEWRLQQIQVSERQVLLWMRQLVEILYVIHNQNYLHRDIKPSNIIVQPNGQLVLINFGTAKELSEFYLKRLSHTSSLISVDSIGYKPPEQMQGETAPQSDFFALGRTLAFLIAGYHPLQMPAKIYDAHQDILHWRRYVNNNISDLILDFIDWLMLHDISERPYNVQEILQRLGEVELRFMTKQNPRTSTSTSTTSTPGTSKSNNKPSNTNFTAEESNHNQTKSTKTKSTKTKSQRPPTLVQTKNTKIQSATSSSGASKPQKIPLLALCAALITSLGLLSLAAFTIRYINLPQIYPIQESGITIPN
ncbi:MAG: serine/threonine-protein kinase [Cyanobacteria bacterium P01_A01_bin.84]